MTPASYVASLLEGVVPESLPHKDRIDPHPHRTGVDLAITAAVTLSRGDQHEGVAIARNILESLPLRASWIGRQEIVPPGFINLTFTPHFFIDALRMVVDERARLSHGAPLPATAKLPPHLHRSHLQLTGILRHAVTLGFGWSRSTDLNPLAATDQDVELARQICMGVRGSATDVPTPGARELTILTLASAIDRFYYECRVVAEVPHLRDARLVLASVAAGLIEDLAEGGRKGGRSN